MTKKEKIKMLEIQNQNLILQVDNLIKNNEELCKTNIEYNDKIADLKSIIRKFEALNEGTPEDCKRGVWCQSCEFAKPISMVTGKFGVFSRNTVYFCGKGEACSNFVQKGL